MKNILKIDLTTYILILLSFFAGKFKDIFIIYIIIIIHEFGHLFWLKIFNKKIINITIYPFGGITKYHSLLNHNIKEELFIAVGGILNQLLLYLPFYILYKYHLINDYSYNLFITYNYYLLIFNILPIIPLDGYRVVNLLLEKILPYHYAQLVSFIISILILIIFIIQTSFKINNIIILSFLIFTIYKYLKNIKYLENKFLLERYLYDIDYSKIKYYQKFNKNYFYQETYHYFNYIPEKKYLYNYLND